jgi:hypothetical protein
MGFNPPRGEPAVRLPIGRHTACRAAEATAARVGKIPHVIGLRKQSGRLGFSVHHRDGTGTDSR